MLGMPPRLAGGQRGSETGLTSLDAAVKYPVEGIVFVQAEDGIRDLTVTGVQTCALPISRWGVGDHAPPHSFIPAQPWLAGHPLRVVQNVQPALPTSEPLRGPIAPISAYAGNGPIREVAAWQGVPMPGKGLEPLRLQRRHLILSQARMTSFATPAAPE